jgi:hypothetical protein
MSAPPPGLRIFTEPGEHGHVVIQHPDGRWWGITWEADGEHDFGEYEGPEDEALLTEWKPKASA